MIRVSGLPEIFKDRPIQAHKLEGSTALNMLESCLMQHGYPREYSEFAVACLNGIPIPHGMLHRIKPKTGTHLTFRIMPQGSSSGEGKSPMRTILSLAVMVVSMWVPGAMGLTAGTWQAGLASSATFAVGMLAVNAIAPIRPPKLKGGEEDRQNYRASGSRNTSNPWGVVPQVLGRNKVYPYYASQPYTEMEGQTQYLRMLFLFGYGPLGIDMVEGLPDVYIGQTSVREFRNVEMVWNGNLQPGETVDGFSNDIKDVEVGTALTYNNTVLRITEPDIDEISIDIDFPIGLYHYREGVRQFAKVFFSVQYRRIGDSVWITHPTGEFASRSMKPARFSRRWKVPINGTYEVRITRTTQEFPEGGENTGDSTWASLRSIKYTTPINFDKPVAVLAMRIRATDQLNGMLDSINAEVYPLVPVWDGSGWSGQQESSNPAAMLKLVLQGPANPRPIPEASIDLESLGDFYEFCEENEFEFQNIREGKESVWDVASDICGAARATVTVGIDGRWSTIIERPREEYSQMVTMHNSWGMSSQRFFIRQPHAWRVRFVNRDANYNQDEYIVYADGYSAANATLFENIEIIGATKTSQIWKIGRYLMASAALRREIFTFNMDFEHLVFSRGSKVLAVHDVPMWGLGSGRVKKIYEESGNVVGVEMDQPFPMSEGERYVIRIRMVDGSMHLKEIINTGVDTRLMFSAFDPKDNDIELENLATYGIYESQTVDLLIRSIAPANDHQAVITAVNYAPEVYFADSGSIPEYDTGITLPQDWTQFPPAPPRLIGIDSGSTSLIMMPDGSIQSGITISATGSGGVIGAATIEIRYKLYDSEGETENDWSIEEIAADDGSIRISPVFDGETYLINLRSISPWGRASQWTPDILHTVIGQSEPPLLVQDFMQSVDKYGVRLWWRKSVELDISGYEIRVGAGSWESASFFASVSHPTSEYISQIQSAGSYTFQIRAIDRMGNYSTESAFVSSTVAAPNAPSPRVDFSGPDVIITWNSVFGLFAVEEYEIRYGNSWESAEFVGTAKTTYYRAKADFSGTRRYWVAGVDIAGNVGAAGFSDAVIISPSAVINLMSNAMDNTVLLNWQPPLSHTLPIDKYQVRRGENFQSAAIIGDVGGTFTPYTESQAGEFTYWIVAVDSAGNFGAPNSVIAVVSAPADYVLRSDEYLNVENGTANNLMYLDDDAIYGPIKADETWGQYIDNGYSTIQSEINAGYDYWPQPTDGGTAHWEKVIDYGAALPATLVTLSHEIEHIAPGADVVIMLSYKLNESDPWIDFYGSQVFATSFRYIKYSISIIGSDDIGFVKVSQIRARLDVKLKSDSGSKELILAGTCLGFNGSNSYVDLGTNYNSVPSNHTIEFWLLSDATMSDGEYGILDAGFSSAHGFKVTAVVDSGVTRIRISTKDSASAIQTREFEASSGFWDHLSITKSGSNIRLQFNDIVLPNIALASSTFGTAHQLRIGNAATHGYFKGRIDDFRIWGAARTVEQINEFQESELPGSTGGLFRNWIMNEGSGSFIQESVNSVNTPVTNTTWEIQRGDRINFSIQFIDVQSIQVNPDGELPSVGLSKFRDVPYPEYFRAYKYDENGNRQTGLIYWNARGV